MKLFLLFILFFSFTKFSYAENFFSSDFKNGYKYNILKFDLNGDYKLSVSFSENGDSLENLLKKSGGISGINGTYFCPEDYEECGGISYSNADILTNGISKGKRDNTGERGLFGIGEDGIPKIFQGKISESGILDGLGNHPILLLEGENILSDFEDLIDEKMKTKSPKNFICSNLEGNKIFMGWISAIDIYSMPKYLIDTFSCYNALNLDSGGSLAMYDNGKYIKREGRPILNAFIVKHNFDLHEYFADVKSNDWFFDYVDIVYKKGIIKGRSEGIFSPGENILRAEAIKSLIIASGLEPIFDENFTYKDVKKEDWFSPYVSTALKNGFLDSSKEFFYPGKNISRAESVKLIIEFIGEKKSDREIIFEDVEKNSWYSGYVQRAFEKNILKGYEGNLFKPQNSITRAEFVKILVEGFNLK